jgi:hypothetical protein
MHELLAEANGVLRVLCCRRNAEPDRETRVLTLTFGSYREAANVSQFVMAAQAATHDRYRHMLRILRGTY